MRKKRICSVVLNTLNNDIRVLKIGKTLSDKSNIVSFIAISNKKMNGLYYKSSLNSNIVYRIYCKDIANIKNSIKRYFEWQFLMRFRLYNVMKILLKREKFDILYCNDFDTLIVTYLFRKRYKFRIVYDSHELWTERKGSKKTVIHRFVNIIEYYIEKYMVRRCDAVITVSEGIAEELSRRYKIKKPYVIRNLDEIKEIPSYKNRMLLRDKLGIPRSAILLVYHGILADERGIPELIDAMDELPENIHLLLMGKYLPDHSRKALKYKGRIHYIGMIPQDELHIYTSIADIGIHPMRTKNILNHYLTFPNKLTQYTNMGLAIAVYKGPETRRIIKQCRCGIIFESGNSGNIIKAIRKIIESGKLSEYKILSRKAFLQYYSWQIDKQKLIKIIKEL